MCNLINTHTHTLFDERLNNRFIHVGVDTSRYALLIGKYTTHTHAFDQRIS